MLLATATLSLDMHAWAIALTACLAALAALAYWRTTPPLGTRTRTVLALLRGAALFLLVLFLLDPRAIRRGEREEAPRVLLLLDRSASMSLPASGWTGGESRFAQAETVVRDLARDFSARGARVETIPYASAPEFASGDSLQPDGQGTDLAGVLEDVARRYEGDHVAAVVVLGDGVDTETPLVRPALPNLRVWTVGVGDTVPPDDVRIVNADYSPVVRVPSRAIIAAEIASSGTSRKRVHIRLAEGARTVFESDTSFAPGNAAATIRVPVRFDAAGRREMVLSVSAAGSDVEPANNRRDIVIDAEKAKARILIVDLMPGWDLAFLTALVAKDPAVECDLFVTPRREAAPVGRVRRPDQFVSSLTGADAVVLASVSEEFLSPVVTDAIRRFVTDRGGGLLVLPGPSSLFETPGAWSRLRDVLPLAGTPPFSFTLQYTMVGPGARAASHPVTAPLVPLLSQTEWQERAPLLGFYAGVSAGASAEPLIGVRGRAVPALVYASAGKGRVAAVAAGPLWRWKFLGGNSGVYDELMTRLLDVLTRGEESGRFVLVARKNVFDAGESPQLYAEVFNEKLQPVTGVPVFLEISRVDSSGAETPLNRVPMRRESADATRLSATVEPLPTGHYSVRGSAELPDRVMQSKPIELRVSATSVEFRRTPQDRAALERVARRTGGAYLTPDGAGALPETVDLSPRRVPVVSESVLRASAPFFLVVLVLLSVEWLLRKRAGMI